MAAQKTLRPSTVSSSTRAEHRGEADYPSTFYRCWSPNTSTSDLGILARLPPTSYRSWFSQPRQGRADKRSSQTSRSGGHGATAVYLLPMLSSTPAGAEPTSARPSPHGLGVMARLPPTSYRCCRNTSRGRADKRSSQTSRSGSHGATAAYLLLVMSSTPAGAEPTSARPRPRGLGVMARQNVRLPPTDVGPPTPARVDQTTTGDNQTKTTDG